MNSSDEDLVFIDLIRANSSVQALIWTKISSVRPVTAQSDFLANGVVFGGKVKGDRYPPCDTTAEREGNKTQTLLLLS